MTDKEVILEIDTRLRDTTRIHSSLDRLFDYIDDLQCSGPEGLMRVDQLLRELDPSELCAQTVSGILTITWLVANEHLLPGRARFLEAARTHEASTNPARAAALYGRFG